MYTLIRFALAISLSLSTLMPLSGSLATGMSNLSSLSSPSVNGTWQSGGPYGGTVISLAVHPANDNIAYVGLQANGIFTTVDGGNSWTAVGNGLPANVNAFGIQFDPSNPQTIWVAGSGNIFQSSDSGQHWTGISGNKFGGQ